MLRVEVFFFEGLWWGTAQHSRYNPMVWKTICWSSSGPTSRSIYTLLNQTCLLDAPPPPLLLLLLWHTHTHNTHCQASFQTQMSLSYFLLLSWLLCIWLWSPLNVSQFGGKLFFFHYQKHALVCGIIMLKYSDILCDTRADYNVPGLREHVLLRARFKAVDTSKPLFCTHTLAVWCRCNVLCLDAIQRLVWVCCNLSHPERKK